MSPAGLPDTLSWGFLPFNCLAPPIPWGPAAGPSPSALGSVFSTPGAHPHTLLGSSVPQLH